MSHKLSRLVSGGKFEGISPLKLPPERLPENKKGPAIYGRAVFRKINYKLVAGSQTFVNLTENFADFATEQCQNTDNDDGDKNKNKCVFYQTLAFFLGEKAPKHNEYSFF
jgi:hypothetical protein